MNIHATEKTGTRHIDKKQWKLEWRCVWQEGGGGGGWSADEGGNLRNVPHKMHLLLTTAIKSFTTQSRRIESDESMKK